MSSSATHPRFTPVLQQKRNGIFRIFYKLRDGWFRLLDADIRT